MPSLPRHRRSNFTLLELLFVMGLITLFATAIPWMLTRLNSESRFEKSVAVLQGKLLVAQELMVDYDTAVLVQFKPHKKGIECALQSVKPVPEALKALLEKKEILEGIEEISVPWVLFDTAGAQKGMTLVIRGKKEVEIALKGYPARIVKGRYEEKKAKTPYPEEIQSAS